MAKDPFTFIYNLRRRLVSDLLWYGFALIVASVGAMTSGEIVGIGIGIAMGVAGLALIARFVLMRRRKTPNS
jgi:hypothetical protein